MTQTDEIKLVSDASTQTDVIYATTTEASTQAIEIKLPSDASTQSDVVHTTTTEAATQTATFEPE